MDRRRLKWTKEHRKRMLKIRVQQRLGSIWPNSRTAPSGLLAWGHLMISTESGARRMHRWVMEQMLGRKLRRGEVVHHKNGDGHDNREENLGLMTQAEHARHHYPEARKNGRFGPQGACLPSGVWSREFPKGCRSCGSCKKRHNGNGLCRRCYMREWHRKDHRK